MAENSCHEGIPKQELTTSMRRQSAMTATMMQTTASKTRIKQASMYWISLSHTGLLIGPLSLSYKPSSNQNMSASRDAISRPVKITCTLTTAFHFQLV